MTNPLSNPQQEIIIEGTPEKKEFSIGSEKYTLYELITALGLDGKSDQEMYDAIAMNLRKGVVQPLNKQTKRDKLLLNVTKGLAHIEHIRKLAAEQAQTVVAKRNQTNQDRLTYNDIKFSVAKRIVMEDVRAYLKNKGIKAEVAQDVDTFEYIFTIDDVTDAELNALDRYLKTKEFTVIAKSAGATALTATSSVLKGTLAVAGSVVSGTAKVTVDVVGKTAEAVTNIGAATVVRSRDIYNEAARNLSENKEAMEAKELISSGWDALRNKLGGKKGSRFF